MALVGIERDDYDECDLFCIPPTLWVYGVWIQLLRVCPPPYICDFCSNEPRELVEKNYMEHFRRQPATWPWFKFKVTLGLMPRRVTGWMCGLCSGQVATGKI